MSVQAADKEWLHLYPPFREALQKTLTETQTATGLHFVLVEGYRSQERQTWLYAAGRTRPGPIVTWKRTPTWHGTGLAADVAPLKDGKVWYDAPRKVWDALQESGRRHGLTNPAYAKGDLGHLQHANVALLPKAKAFIRAGFREV